MQSRLSSSLPLVPVWLVQSGCHGVVYPVGPCHLNRLSIYFPLCAHVGGARVGALLRAVPGALPGPCRGGPEGVGRAFLKRVVESTRVEEEEEELDTEGIDLCNCEFSLGYGGRFCSPLRAFRYAPRWKPS